MRSSYDITLEKGDSRIKICLRLTLGGQINLKKKYKEATGADGVKTALNVIFAAMDDAEIMAGVFTEALCYPGNENTIKDGMELYDLMVDNGYCGSESFVPILTGIAVSSGLLSQDKKDAIDRMAQRKVEEEISAAQEISKNA